MPSRIRFFAIGAAIAIAAILYIPATYYFVRAAVRQPSPLLASQVWFMTMDAGILIFMLRNKGRAWLSGVWRHWFRYFAVWVLLGFASIAACSKFAPSGSDILRTVVVGYVTVSALMAMLLKAREPSVD
jgi:hypothetical protein